MSRGVNKAIIVGNLGRDPEVRQTSGGLAICNCTVATTHKAKDQEVTEWHRVIFFGKLADVAGEYLKKGSQVYIEGRIQTRKWQDQSGQDRYTTEIVANEMQMIGGKEQPKQERQQGGGDPKPSRANDDFDDQDIPFISDDPRFDMEIKIEKVL